MPVPPFNVAVYTVLLSNVAVGVIVIELLLELYAIVAATDVAPRFNKTDEPVTEAGFKGSLNTAVKVVPIPTLVAFVAGLTEITCGGVRSEVDPELNTTSTK